MTYRPALDHGDIRATQVPICDRDGVIVGRRVTVTRLTDAMTKTNRCPDDFDGPDGVFAVADRMASELLRFSA